METGRFIALLCAAGLLAAASADAAPRGTIVLKTIAETEFEVVNERGEKEIVRKEAARVTPGDAVVYTVSWRNTGPAAAEDVVITNPVPEHMVCVAVEAGADARVTLSIDGGKTFDAAANLIVQNEDGSERPAELGDCTHIRWNFAEPVAPGASGEVSFRAVLR